MKLFSKLFRRKPSPPTPKQARAILEAAIEQTLGSGLQGYLVAEVGDDAEGEVIFSANGDLGEGLSKALEIHLENPHTRAAAQYAIITALKASGKVRQFVVGDADCDCPMCTARRAKEERRPNTTTH